MQYILIFIAIVNYSIAILEFFIKCLIEREEASIKAKK
jgi:hypothetical protein